VSENIESSGRTTSRTATYYATGSFPDSRSCHAANHFTAQ